MAGVYFDLSGYMLGTGRERLTSGRPWLLWTPDASKIIVDGPVFHKMMPQISEAEILYKAKVLTPAYSKFIKSLRRTK